MVDVKLMLISAAVSAIVSFFISATYGMRCFKIISNFVDGVTGQMKGLIKFTVELISKR